MKFAVGDVLDVDGGEYKVVGIITYQNSADNCVWDEYRMISVRGHKEAWLSIDNAYREYSISFVVRQPSIVGYHMVDQGREVVVSASGNVDVEYGDAAYFTEYEDQTEEKIISKEVWDDGTEFSEGYYLDDNEIVFQRSEPMSSGHIGSSGSRAAKIVAAIMVIGIVAVIVVPMIASLFQKSVSDYLNDDEKYTYSTSITGKSQQKADVYKADTGMTVDSVSRDIIDGISGNTQYVQQNTEDGDGSVALLTDNEYCMIYYSEEDEAVLVQVSGRAYAYTSDNDLYHGTRYATRYFRRFYYTNGYSSDASEYSSYSSPYGSFSDTGIIYSSTNSYNNYSSSVRQSSIFSRISSGGGLGGGK